VAPETLLHGIAGWAWLQSTYSLDIGGVGSKPKRADSTARIGAGIETMIAPGWIARLE